MIFIRKFKTKKDFNLSFKLSLNKLSAKLKSSQI